MAELSSSERFELWDRFSNRWPIEKLQAMGLSDYTKLQGKDSFCYWLENLTSPLGSIWGGSSFKFGVFEYNPNVSNTSEASAGIRHDNQYKWLKKYGNTADEAFEKVKGIIISIAKAASEGNLSIIDKADLGHATKWKIAFLYQQKNNIKIPCVYRLDWLRAYAASYDSKVPSSQLYSIILDKKDADVDIFSFSDEIWKRVKDNYENAWMIAAGEGGYLWDDFVNSNMIKMGWNDVGDLSSVSQKEHLKTIIEKAYPNYSSEGKGNSNKVVEMLWAFLHEMKVGDVVFVKIGTSQIVGRGTVQSEYTFGDYGEFQHGRDIEWSHTGKWIAPFGLAQRTIYKLKPDQCKQLEDLVSHEVSNRLMGSHPKKTEDDIMNTPKDTIPYALNTIFYGPPGTGKTYMLLDKLAKDYFYERIGHLTEIEKNAKAVADLSWWEAVALCLLDMGDSAKVPQIMEHSLMSAHIKNTNAQNPANAVWGQLQTHAVEDCPYVNFSKRTDPKVFSKSKDSTWTVDRNLLSEIRPDLFDRLKLFQTKTETTEIIRYKFITFHQSYSYENFVEGICAETDENGNIHYEVNPGIFWKFCQQAQSDPDHNYALFIDEINRGNISGIFGELISLIEEDKRERLHVTLPYSRKDFFVPKNLYIFGSMNTADRSIDVLDTALRRRFDFVEMAPNPELLNKPDYAPKCMSIDLCALLKSINRRVEFLLDRDHMIGHSYFMKIQAQNADDELRNLQKTFKNQVIPLLEDYFYGNLEKVQMVLGDKIIVPDDQGKDLKPDCLMCIADDIDYQEKISLKVADLSKLTVEDFSGLIKK